MKFDAKFSKPQTLYKPSFGGTIYTVPGSGSNCEGCVKSVNGILPDEAGNITISDNNTSEIVTQVLAKAIPRVVTVVLDVDGWTDNNIENDTFYIQTLELENITQYSRLDLQPDAKMISDMRALGVVFTTKNVAGTIFVKSIGSKPTKTYSIQASIIETEPVDERDTILGIPVGAAVDIPEAISPVVSIDKVDKKTTIVIEDINGTSTAEINDGQDGTGITSTEINSDGELVIYYSDDTSNNVGVVVGPEGQPGKSGVYVGTEEPDENTRVWINLDAEVTSPDSFVTKQDIETLLNSIVNGNEVSY